jgi:hypothetical protein
VEVVVVVDVETPSADVGDVDVEPFQIRRLSFPDRLRATRVLIPDGHLRLSDPVHLLLVHVALVPREDVQEIRIRFVSLDVQRPFDFHPHVDVSQGLGNGGARQSHVDGAQVAGGLRALVHQVEVGAGDGDRLLDDLRFGKNDAAAGQTAHSFRHPSSGDDRFEEFRIVVVAGGRQGSVRVEEGSRHPRKVYRRIPGEEALKPELEELGGVERAVVPGVQVRHVGVLAELHVDGGQDHDLVPGHEDRPGQGLEGRPLELECDGAAPVHEHVEPAAGIAPLKMQDMGSGQLNY